MTLCLYPAEAGMCVYELKHTDILYSRTVAESVCKDSSSVLSFLFCLQLIYKDLLISTKMARNLLKNPNGDEDMEFWELTENGGNEWRVEDMPGDCGHEIGIEGVNKYFSTSFELCLKTQVIDLVAEGYAPEDLDNQPTVTIEDWYSGRTDCGCMYLLTVRLLDENKEMLSEYKPEPVILDPDTEDCLWKQVTHTLSDYGPGLRFISFEHGGKDTKYWDGWFGVRVTGSYVAIDL